MSNAFGCNAAWSECAAGEHTAASATLLAIAARQDTRLTLERGGEVRQWQLTAGSHALLWLDAGATLCATGDHAYKRLSVDALCLLIAFVDAGMERNIGGDRRDPLDVLTEVDVHVCDDDRALERLAIADAIGETPRMACHARSVESYLLLRFMLDEPSSPKLRELSQRYGLSYSYFRKKCRAAIGGRVKTQLCEWRAARSALDIIERGGSILDIALENGFSSASHISRDLKARFGVTPSTFATPDLLWKGEKINGRS
jgi:AraC-like DNA-binding protein